jgi:hypothetical protein
MPSAPRFVLVTSSRPNKGSEHLQTFLIELNTQVKDNGGALDQEQAWCREDRISGFANGGRGPIRPRPLVPTQQGVGTLAPNDLTPCRMAFYFVSGHLVEG